MDLSDFNSKFEDINIINLLPLLNFSSAYSAKNIIKILKKYSLKNNTIQETENFWMIWANFCDQDDYRRNKMEGCIAQ